jgi:hypothetical protein
MKYKFISLTVSLSRNETKRDRNGISWQPYIWPPLLELWHQEQHFVQTLLPECYKNEYLKLRMYFNYFLFFSEIGVSHWFSKLKTCIKYQMGQGRKSLVCTKVKHLHQRKSLVFMRCANMTKWSYVQ